MRRVRIPKPDGGERPPGIAALEDEIVQRALVDIVLNPIYEAEFLGCSYGFRPGRGAHDALDALACVIEQCKANWIVDCDIRKHSDEINRDWLIRFPEHRIGDRRVIRLIGKWLHAGVMEDGLRDDTGKGSPQGAIIAPFLANVYLHYVLDLWMDRKWRKRAARGEVRIIRYADDFGLCERNAVPRRRGALLAGCARALRAMRPEAAPREDPADRISTIRDSEPAEAGAGKTGDVRLSRLHALLP